MIEQIPTSALTFGFVNGLGGTHTSRTMMLAELRLLLSAGESTAPFQRYRTLVAEENVLLKPTMTTRLRSLRGLRELYALDSDIVLFDALRKLWPIDADAQPLLALLCAIARDPVFRATADFILGLPLTAAVTPKQLSVAVQEALPDRYNANILGKIGRNIASSWQQSGHLQGKTRKVRARVECQTVVVAYALLQGYLCGVRGDGLFETLWARLLDTSTHTLREHAAAASRLGWLEYRHAGGITEIGFSHLLHEDTRGDR